MRHQKVDKKLGRNLSHRKAMLRNMVTSLFEHSKIETTDAKAKALRPVAEKLISLAKKGDLHSRRQILAFVEKKSVAHRLVDEIKNQYLDRQGGYLKIIKKGVRKGDNAPISIIQLLKTDSEAEKPKKKAKTTKKDKATPTKKTAKLSTTKKTKKSDKPVKKDIKKLKKDDLKKDK